MRLITLLALIFAMAGLGQPAAAKAVASPPSVAKPFALPERELMVPVEGGRVWVSVNGDLKAKALPVVFVHGGPGGTHLSFGGMTALADSRAVILYDQLDSGMSDHPGDPANWHIERFVEELEAVRRTLGVERWHVVGHSWGSAIAIEYSVKYPEHVASTLLGGTFISTPQWIFGTNLLIKDLPADVQHDIAACQSNAPPAKTVCDAADDAFYAVHAGRPDAPARSAAAIAYRERTSGKGFNPTIYNAMWGPSEFVATGSLKTYDDTHLLAKLDGSRTMFLVGQYDEARLDTVRDFVRLTPGAELAVVPGASHAAYSERPIEMEGILRGWLARKDPE